MSKTTIAGIVAIVAAVLSVVATVLQGGAVDWSSVGTAIVAAIGLIAGGVGLVAAQDSKDPE